MKRLFVTLLLTIVATAAQAQCGPYGQYPCRPPPYYAANPPRPPPPEKPMPCPNCGRGMIYKDVWQPGRGWVRVYTCPECQ